MAVQNQTMIFRELVEVKRKEMPEAKRRKLSRSPRRVPGDNQREGTTPLMQQYMGEAYNILNHINTLTRMLANIRRPYLDVHSRHPAASRSKASALDFSDLNQAFADIRHLTNEERDQIDLQVRVILTRCADRVKDMEALENRRAELASKQANPLLRILPVRLRHDSTTSASEYVAAHNSAVSWYLTRRLAEVSQQQTSMQEERVKRQTERTRTLGSGAAREAIQMGIDDAAVSESGDSSGSWILSGASSTLASSFASTIGASYPAGASSSTSALLPTEFDEDDEDEDDEDVELSASQIQQFESENAQILRAVEDTYASVQQAESRLLEISALQMELVAQLTRQTEVTDKIYDDAIATTEFVDKGNLQLREARRRARDGRMWILLFLIGASLSLLFLHYY
ncbi:hypothetical protein EW146_g7088 [Bondarzewia mesenterica]|uniref:t-SNARE coiled-coil homology domain-containing protein n=1 Tax=Bondarzewia mesenterica TaxID=1095465 RepID=A0A4S4LMD5_9AGAM|nr:hypothetical protein EW146_g7088 [Bondarzewia mesenterica]